MQRSWRTGTSPERAVTHGLTPINHQDNRNSRRDTNGIWRMIDEFEDTQGVPGPPSWFSTRRGGWHGCGVGTVDSRSDCKPGGRARSRLVALSMRAPAAHRPAVAVATRLRCVPRDNSTRPIPSVRPIRRSSSLEPQGLKSEIHSPPVVDHHQKIIHVHDAVA